MKGNIMTKQSDGMRKALHDLNERIEQMRRSFCTVYRYDDGQYWVFYQNCPAAQARYQAAAATPRRVESFEALPEQLRTLVLLADVAGDKVLVSLGEKDYITRIPRPGCLMYRMELTGFIHGLEEEECS